MDKRTLIALVVIGVILFGFSWYNNNQYEKSRREAFVADSLDRVAHPEKYIQQATAEIESTATSMQEAEQRRIAQEEADRQALISNMGESLVAAMSGEEKLYTLENDVMRMTVSSRGGQISNVELKDYKRYNGEDLMMFLEGSNKFNITFFMRKTFNYAQINTADYYFTSDQPDHISVSEGDNGRSLALRLPVDSMAGAYLEYVYTMRPDDYMVDFRVNYVGMREWTDNLTDFSIDWSNTSVQNEKGFKNENMYTTIAYRYPNAKGIEQLGASENTKSENISTRLHWFGFKQQFFSSFLIADDDFIGADLKFDTYKPGYGIVKQFSAKASVPFDRNKDSYGFKYYFGPNKYSTLRAHGEKFEKVIPLGGSLISWINTGFVIKIFDWLGKHIASMGVIILILTVMIKLIILPLTYTSYMSSAKMRVLKPELDEINERYPKQEDAMKKQQAVMALYKQTGVKPMGGCLPMLIQFPILIAMFRFFPASIELRGQKFLWADDLSAYDSILDLPFSIPFYGDHISLFTLLMATSMFIYSKVNYKLTASAGPQMAGMKFMTVYLMPIMMLAWFNSYASGLTYYYLLSNLFTIIQMTGFRFFVNENKLHEKLKSNAANASSKNKTKPKSKWQQRYEAALKQQQEAMRQQQAGGGVPKTKTRQQSTNRQPGKKRK